MEDQLRNLTYDANESITWTYYLLSDSLNLSSGDYEVLTYLLIRHNQSSRPLTSPAVAFGMYHGGGVRLIGSAPGKTD